MGGGFLMTQNLDVGTDILGSETATFPKQG